MRPPSLRPDSLPVALLLIALLGGCRTAKMGENGGAVRGSSNPEQGAANPIHLTIVGTNDVHGHIFSQQRKLRDGTPMEEGGVAAFGGYLENLRADNPGGVILLDAGDMFQGTLVSNLTEGAVVVDAFNALGYSAAALGNHEFDYGPVGPVSTAQPGQDPFGALKARIQQAKFPVLSVNVYEVNSSEHPAWFGNDGTAMLKVKGLKVGIFGLTTPTTPQTTNPVNVSTLRFGSLAPEAASAARALRAKGADVVIAIAHAGGNCTKFENPRDLSSCDLKDSEIVEMLQELPPATLDAVVAGHTHHGVGHFFQGTPVIETWGMLETFGTIDLFVDPQQKNLLPDLTVIKPVIPICLQVDSSTKSCDPRMLAEIQQVNLIPASFLQRPIVPSAALAKLIEPAREKVLAEQNRKLGIQVPRPLQRKREGESPIGLMLADALREMEKTDIAFVNPGGLRADVSAGDLTYGQIYEVLPFDNTVANVVVTGEELNRLARAAYNGRAGVYAESGLNVTLSRCPGQARLKSITLANGKPIAPENKYRIAMPDFLARGGDGLAGVLSSLPAGHIDLGSSREHNLRESLILFWQKKKQDLVAPSPGRIRFLDDSGSCSASGS